MIEIRWHGRGGQGAVTSAELLAMAAIIEGKYAVAIPYFGAERRGAPVIAYNRISNKPIRIRSNIRNPDYVVVLDPLLGKFINIYEGLKKNGTIVINTVSPMIRDHRVAYVDATAIALKIGLVGGGIPIVNTAMLGALIKISNLVSINSVVEAIENKWRGKVAERNIKAVVEAYNSTKIKGE